MEFAAKERRLALRLTRARKARHWSATRLAAEVRKKMRVGAEQVRRVAKGDALPSDALLAAIGQVLELDFGELRDFAISDRIARKHGGVPRILAKINPELAPLEALWPQLSDDQKDALIRLAASYAQTN